MKFLLVWIGLLGAAPAPPPVEYESMELCQEALWNLTPEEERNEVGTARLYGWYCISEQDQL